MRVCTAVAVAWAAVTAGAAPAAPSAIALDAPLQQSVDALLHLGAVAPFSRPLVLESRLDGGQVSAVAEGLIERPFGDVAAALVDARHWCALLILHINNKGCAVTSPGGHPHIALKVARKYDQPVDQAFEFDFAVQVLKASANELAVSLEAPHGPMGTSDYGIHLDAVPAGDARTAVRLSYAYKQGSLTGWGMDLYMATVGRGKVGFSLVSPGSGKPAELVSGLRGLLERNLMRYFLAIDAAANTPAAARPEAYERRLRDWFAATEKYPRQLHEIDLETYLALKRSLQAVGVLPGVAPASGRGP